MRLEQLVADTAKRIIGISDVCVEVDEGDDDEEDIVEASVVINLDELSDILREFAEEAREAVIDAYMTEIDDSDIHDNVQFKLRMDSLD